MTEKQKELLREIFRLAGSKLGYPNIPEELATLVDTDPSFALDRLLEKISEHMKDRYGHSSPIDSVMERAAMGARREKKDQEEAEEASIQKT